MRPHVHFEWRGNHHLYYGVFLVIFAVFNYYMGIDNGELTKLLPLWKLLIGIGAFMMIDDIIEHLFTADTPLRLIYDKIIRPRLK